MENISKIVIAQDTGKRIGYVLDAVIDYQDSYKKTGYYVVDEETEGEFFLKNENILKIGQEYIMISSAGVLEFVLTRKDSLIGKHVVGDECQEFGMVTNLVFAKNKLEKLTTNKCEIMAKLIKEIGEDFVFVSSKKKRTKKHVEIFPRMEADIKVTTQENFQVSVPQKITLSAGFYIGKFSTQDIFGYNNERIVAKGEKISRTIFENAKKHNKLNQLFFAVDRWLKFQYFNKK